MSNEVMQVRPTEYPVIWLQTASCSGCSVSVLNSVSPAIQEVLIEEVLPGKHVNLRFHPTIMAGQGEPALEIMEETSSVMKGSYLLVVEGAVPTADGGLYGTLGERGLDPVTMQERTEALARDALAVVALGSCAAYGGIPAAAPNPTGGLGVKAFLGARGVEAPVINVPGCPAHPDWFLGTVTHLLLFGLPRPDEVDEVGRPKAFYGQLIHDHCPRRADFEVGQFAKKPGDPGCLYKVGCKGPVTYADCPTRLWNGGTNWCIGCGSPCIGCVEPEFFDLTPLYERLGDALTPVLRIDPETGRLDVHRGLERVADL